MPIHHVKELLGHANIKTTDTYLNATRIGLQQSMKKYEEFRKDCTNVAQNEQQQPVGELFEGDGEGDDVTLPPGVTSGGVDGARTRDLRRDRPAF